MKKLTKLILAGLLTVSSLNAKEILFDLRAQDFSISTQAMTKYKVNDKIILEKNIVKETKGYYRTGAGVKGIINIEITKDITNWKFNQDIVFYTIAKNKKRLIYFMDKFGENIILEFYKTGFTINGKEYKANTYKEHMLISVTKKENNLLVSINGQKIYTSSIEFNNLKSISTVISQYDKYSWDRLNNILLVSND